MCMLHLVFWHTCGESYAQAGGEAGNGNDVIDATCSHEKSRYTLL